MLIIQMTGLSGAGKSTIAQMVSDQLLQLGFSAVVLDGDAYRKTLCSDLGFSKADRMENIRRLGSLANTYKMQGTIAIIAAINPIEVVRQELKVRYNAKVVWVDCPMDVLISRDTKGLYRRAFLADGHPEKLTNFTGVNDIYDQPIDPDFHVNTSQGTPEVISRQIIGFICSLINEN